MVERIKNERETKSRWVGKTLLATVALLAVVALFGARFYQTVQAPYWNTLDRAEAEAFERLDLQSVDAVERFVGDRPYSIVTGVDASGTPVLVWLWGEDGVHVERQDAGVSRADVKAAALAERPEMQLLRIAPGKLGETYVWEVFYSVRESNGTRKYYDYYRFADGEKIETYRLALERE